MPRRKNNMTDTPPAPITPPADPAHLAFYPPLIRLQQQAPSPIGRRVLWCLLALLVFLLVWASVGRLDIVAVAEGKLVPQDYLKIVQPSEAGIVSDILVREGQTVQKDQVLMRMDALTTDADLNALGTERWRKQLALRRLDAELAEQALTFEADDPPPLAQEAQAQQLANQAAQASALAEERSRMLKAQQELAAAQQQSQRLQAVLPHFQAQETAYTQLADQGFTGQLMVSDKRRERIEKEQELATQQHVIASAKASIDQSVKKLEQIRAEHRQRLHTERTETRSQVERLNADWQKQHHRRDLMELRAPHEGIVKELATHTVGTVVQPGTVLATLVPQQSPLKVEVWISNDDIGFVRPGQPVKLKLAAYPFQKYGMAHGALQWINADAQTDEPSRATAPDGALPPPRYKATVALKEAALERDGRSYELTAGMQAQAEILLGQRTVLQYLLSPVQRAWHEAGRER